MISSMELLAKKNRDFFSFWLAEIIIFQPFPEFNRIHKYARKREREVCSVRWEKNDQKKNSKNTTTTTTSIKINVIRIEMKKNEIE